MNKAIRYIKKFLDKAELDALVKYDRWLRAVFSHIPLGIGEQEIHQYHLPQPGMLSSLLYQHSAEMFTVGQGHGDAETAALRRKFKVKLATLPVLEANREFTPEEALKVLRARQLKLAGDVEMKLVSAIKQILLDYLVGGDRRAAQKSIATLLEHNEARAANIVRTETTYAYNRGRLASYRENNVDYVRFSAILDSRTSVICRSRHGLVMAMDDPDLSANTPPLHGHCRSVLTPIYSRYEPDLITPENTNWRHVVPLPKGWLTDGRTTAQPLQGKPHTELRQLVDGTTKRAEVLKVGKTEIITPLGTNSNMQHFTASDIESAFKSLPHRLRKHVEEIQILDFRNPHDLYWEQMYGIKDFRSFATGGHGQIHFYANEHMTRKQALAFLPEALAHEAGHILDEYLSTSTVRFSRSALWENIRKLDAVRHQVEWVSKYASDSRSPQEDFAESVRLIFLDAFSFKQKFPNRYKFLKRELGL